MSQPLEIFIYLLPPAILEKVTPKSKELRKWVQNYLPSQFQGHRIRSISPGLLGSGCGCVPCMYCCEYSPSVCVSLQPTVSTWHQPGPPQTPPLPLQVQLWLQLQMSLLRTSPQSLITQSHVGELCTPGLSRWERILWTGGIGKLGPGHSTDKYLKSLVNWMWILHLVSFFFFFLIKWQRSAQSIQTIQGPSWS